VKPTERSRRAGPPIAVLGLLLLAQLFPGGRAACGSDPAAARTAGPFLYDLDFSLFVTGSMTHVARTRFCLAEDLHLKLAAAPGNDGWVFRSLALNEDRATMNVSAGEGPRRHQRYVLVSRFPSEAEMRSLEDRILTWEEGFGCAVAPGPDETEEDGEGLPEKKAFFNYYLLEGAEGAFGFVLDPLGRTLEVTDRTRLAVLSEPGGKRAEPRFFGLLESALRCIPPFAGPYVYSVGSDEPVQWEEESLPIVEGLVGLVRHVFDRKMTLMETRGMEGRKLVYRGRFAPGTGILRAAAEMGESEPVLIRVSGLKGSLWIQDLRREICLDVGEKRILKDVFEISFGLVRDATILPIRCEHNSIRVSLTDPEFHEACGTPTFPGSGPGAGAPLAGR